MSAAANLLTLDEFRARYSDDDKLEFWYGKAKPRFVGAWLHSALQIILANLFKAAGYKTGVELELRISLQFQPRPDVAAALRIEQPYPTRPIEIVAEILSPDDTTPQMITKCRYYALIGIGQIFVFDPEKRKAQIWNSRINGLQEIEIMKLGNGSSVPVAKVWAELDELLTTPVK